MEKRKGITRPDDFDILSAIWVMASNDENPIISYEGIKYRLRLPPDIDLRGLVESRGDLFRRGVPTFRLDEWKQDMLNGKQIPAWLREVDDENVRRQKILSITVNDVFRSQFRSRRESERSSIEIIDWGLRHIDRLRKAHVESREQSAKSWQMWLVFSVGILNFLATLGIAVFAWATRVP